MSGKRVTSSTDLKQEWLPLAGLFWLKPGENRFAYGSEKRSGISQRPGPRRIF